MRILNPPSVSLTLPLNVTLVPIGKAAVDALRNCLSPELRDKLCPLRNGGVSLHKLYGVMHDTCNCGNKVTRTPTLYAEPRPVSKPFPLNLTRTLLI